MSDYLPPVVLELEGRDAQLLRTLESAKAEVRRWTTDVGRMKADVGVKLDLATGEVQKIQRQVGQIKATVRVGLRLDDTATRERLDELTRDRNISASVGVRLDIAQGEVQKLQQRIGKIKATVRVGLRLDDAATIMRLDHLTRDRTVTITTRTVGGGPAVGGSGSAGMIKALLPFAPVLAPIAASATATAAALGAATVAAGVFGIALLGQTSALGDAADAHKKYLKAVDQYGATSDQAAKAQQELARTLAAMPPATRQAAVAFLDLKKDYNAWSKSLASFTMAPVTQGLSALDGLLPRLSPLVKESATQFSRITSILDGGINSGAFDHVIDKFTTFAGGALQNGVDHIIHFARVMSEGRAEGPISEFMTFVRANGPLVSETLHNLGSALTTIMQAAGEAGPGMLALVNSAAQLIAALPPSAIATIMQIAVALKLIGLARAVIAATATSVGGLTTRIATLRAVSIAAGGGLGGLRAAFLSLNTAAKATVIVAALAAIGVAVAKIASLGQDAPPDVDKLTNSLGRLGQGKELQGEALKVFGEDLEGLRDSIKSFVAPSVMDNIQQGIVKVFTLGTTDSTPVKEAKQNLDAIDEALANLVQNGNADLAAAALEKLKASYAKGGHDVSKFTGSLGEYKKAVDDAKFAQDLAAESQGLFGHQAQDTQRTLDAQKASADGLRNSLQALNDVQRSALDGQIGFQAAIDAATKSAEDNGRALRMKNGQLDLGTQKARDEAQALADLAAKTDENAASARDNGASWSTVNGIYAEGRRKLIEVAQQMGLNETQAKQLADQILKTPDKTARMKMDTEDATAGLNAFNAALKRSPGAKSVTLKTLSAAAEKVLESFGYKVTHLKDGSVTVSAKTGAALRNIGDVRGAVDSLHDKTITVTINGVKTGVDPRQYYSQGPHAYGGPVRRASGGPVQAFPSGGYIDGPGTPTSDSILALFASGATALVSDTEYVVQAAAVRKYGLPMLEALNAGQLKLAGFAGGGATKAEKAPRAELSKQFGISSFGRIAGYQRTPFVKSLSDPTDMSALVSALNGVAAQIKASFHGKTETQLLKQLQSAGKSLIAYDKQLTKVTSSLASAKAKLDDLKQSAAQLKTSVASSIMSGNSIVTQAPQQGLPLTAQDVVNNMTAQYQQTAQFTAALETLKSRGLSAELLQQIASAGVEQGGATANALLNANSGTLQQLNTMQGKMQSSANAAGAAIADSMYGAGIRAAQGLVKGLSVEQKAIEAAMLRIATSMQASIKAALGIKSPSTVMALLGDHTAVGLAHGITRSSKHAVIAARDMALSVAQSAVPPLPSYSTLAGLSRKRALIAARGMAMSATQGAVPPLPSYSSLPALKADRAAVVHHHYEPHIAVEGHVLTERKLRDLVQEQMLQLAGRSPETWQPYKR